MNRELLWAHGAHGEVQSCSTNGELVRAHNVSVNHSADACSKLSMARNMSHCIVVLWHAQGVWEAVGGYIRVGECVEFD